MRQKPWPSQCCLYPSGDTLIRRYNDKAYEGRPRGPRKVVADLADREAKSTVPHTHEYLTSVKRWNYFFMPLQLMNGWLLRHRRLGRPR